MMSEGNTLVCPHIRFIPRFLGHFVYVMCWGFRVLGLRDTGMIGDVSVFWGLEAIGQFF